MLTEYDVKNEDYAEVFKEIADDFETLCSDVAFFVGPGLDIVGIVFNSVGDFNEQKATGNIKKLTERSRFFAVLAETLRKRTVDDENITTIPKDGVSDISDYIVKGSDSCCLAIKSLRYVQKHYNDAGNQSYDRLKQQIVDAIYNCKKAAQELLKTVIGFNNVIEKAAKETLRDRSEDMTKQELEDIGIAQFDADNISKAVQALVNSVVP